MKFADDPEEPESNVSRLWRDTAGNSVWEGTSNVLASETVKHLIRDDNLKAFGSWVYDAVSRLHDPYRPALQSVWVTLAWLISGILLGLGAERDSELTAHEVARRWILEGEGMPGEFTFPAITHSFLRVAPGVESKRP